MDRSPGSKLSSPTVLRRPRNFSNVYTSLSSLVVAIFVASCPAAEAPLRHGLLTTLAILLSLRAQRQEVGDPLTAETAQSGIDVGGVRQTRARREGSELKMILLGHLGFFVRCILGHRHKRQTNDRKVELQQRRRGV